MCPNEVVRHRFSLFIDNIRRFRIPIKEKSSFIRVATISAVNGQCNYFFFVPLLIPSSFYLFSSVAIVHRRMDIRNHIKKQTFCK